MIIKLFRNAGATGHVFLLKNGKTRNKGLAYSGLIGPQTTVAVVPTTPQILNFAIEAQTKDKQRVVVRGNLKATLIPAFAIAKFDFTVNPKDGSYISPWQLVLNAQVIERVLRAVLGRVKEINVEEATRSQKEVEDAVTAALGASALAEEGIKVDSCSIPKIEPADNEVEKAIGAKERQELLAEADKALHDRRIQAATNERAVKQYEAETELELEKKQSELIDEQSKNKAKEATADAEATKVRLDALKDIESGKILGAALMDGAKTGRFGNLTITTDFLAALGHTK